MFNGQRTHHGKNGCAGLRQFAVNNRFQCSGLQSKLGERVGLSARILTTYHTIDDAGHYNGGFHNVCLCGQYENGRLMRRAEILVLKEH